MCSHQTTCSAQTTHPHCGLLSRNPREWRLSAWQRDTNNFLLLRAVNTSSVSIASSLRKLRFPTTTCVGLHVADHSFGGRQALVGISFLSSPRLVACKAKRFARTASQHGFAAANEDSLLRVVGYKRAHMVSCQEITCVTEDTYSIHICLVANCSRFSVGRSPDS